MRGKSKPVLMLVGGTWCYGVRDHVEYLQYVSVLTLWWPLNFTLRV